jgi:pilus assembly protein CpaC
MYFLRYSIMLVMIGVTMPAYSVVFDPVFGTQVDDLQVPINQSRILVFDDVIENISVGNPLVADVLVLESRKIYVIGKSLGSTNVVVWGRGQGREINYNTFKVEITYDLDGLKGLLHKLMPDEEPKVQATEGAIILSGQVSSPAKMDAIMVLATQFVHNTKRFSLAHKGGGGGKKGGKAPSEIINLMTIGGPHQVMMKVTVAEVSRSIMKQFGVNLASLNSGSPWIVGAVNGGASFPSTGIPIFGGSSLIGPGIRSFEPSVPGISSSGLFASYLSGSNYLNLVIDASKNDGLAKILAEPTLTTMSGEPASFLSGGEFPVPVWGGSDQGIKVKFKEFGISVKAMPLVMDTGRIKLSLNISVSELTDAAGVASTIPGSTVALTIPSLSTRSASSTVELMDGQTMGIAGLISDKMRESITKFPGLGDIPVLGALFRSQSYINDKTELVMFVTVHLAKPIDPKKIRLPTEAYSDPSTAEFFLLGRMNSKKEPVRRNLQMTSVTTNLPHEKKNDQVISSEPASKPEVDNTVRPEPAERPLTGGPTFGHAL